MSSELPIPASEQTKRWRQSQQWYKNGKHNECEKYQVKTLKEYTGIDVPNTKTGIRLNIITHELSTGKNISRDEDSFDWTEDFDGLSESEIEIMYINLKFVCDNGGAPREIKTNSNCSDDSVVRCTNKVKINNDGKVSEIIIPQYNKCGANPTVEIKDCPNCATNSLTNFLQKCVKGRCIYDKKNTYIALIFLALLIMCIIGLISTRKTRDS